MERASDRLGFRIRRESTLESESEPNRQKEGTERTETEREKERERQRHEERQKDERVQEQQTGTKMVIYPQRVASTTSCLPALFLRCLSPSLSPLRLVAVVDSLLRPACNGCCSEYCSCKCRHCAPRGHRCHCCDPRCRNRRRS